MSILCGFPWWTRFELLRFARRQRSRRLSSGFKHLRLPEAPYLFAEQKGATRGVWFLGEQQPAPGP
jgi:hypothetical protein